MIKIVFKSTISSMKDRAFFTKGVILSRNNILADVNGSDVPIARGTGSLWHVGNLFFDVVEIAVATKTEINRFDKESEAA